MLFNFDLKHPLKCAGLEKDRENDSYVCWFYLTDSEYFIDLGEVRLFESSPQWIEKCKDEHPPVSKYCDYQYSRQLEDLFDILPTIACPIPSNLYRLVETDEKRDHLHDKITDIWESESPPGEPWNEVDEKYDNIIRNLIYYGNLDSGYLRVRTECQFFHVDGIVIIRYDFIDKDEEDCPVWSAGKGTYTLTYNEFLREIEDLLSRFFAAMDKQVETAMLVFSEKAIEESNLAFEHARRKDYFYSILNSMKNNTYKRQIDWQKLKEDLNSILKKDC